MQGKTPGEKLAALRGEMRREALAAELGISVSSLCAYENGTRNPGDAMKRRISEYFGVTVGWLFFGESAAQPSDEGKAETT